MFDSQYFTGQFNEQVKQMGGHPTVKLHLHSGDTYDLGKIEGIEPGYILVEVYPPNGSIPVLDQTSDEPRLTNSVRLSISYESIAQVEITKEKPKGRGPVGFQGY